MSRTRMGNLLAVSLLAAGMSACASREVDPRSMIRAPNDEYVGRLAQAMNGSKLWRAYFNHVAPDASTAQPLVAVTLEMDRRVTRTGTGGDYDPGTVQIRFTVANLRNRAVLYHEDKSTRLDDVIFGMFDENTTREEIQQAAFEEAEDDVFPFLNRWLNIAALRAIAQLGQSGEALTPLLEAQVEDPWAEDLASEANLALTAIRGGGR